MAHLFTPFRLKSLELKNRIMMSPMCQYSVSARDGKPNDWHLVHYTSRAIGGAALIMMEMTDVEPDGRISDFDLGLWSDDHIPAFARIIESCHRHGAKVGIQIAHAGRKAQDAPVPVAPSPIRFPADGYKTPRELTTDEVKAMVEKFHQAARRAVKAGVDTLEIHAAHGYLLHQFQSPLTNRRKDVYGDDLARFGSDVVAAVKAAMPADMPLLMRISAVEYAEGGYGLDHAVALCRRYREAGVDMFDVSSGGESVPAPGRGPSNHPGYQVPFAARIREEVNTPVVSVGFLDDPRLAEAVVANCWADVVAVARGLLRDPYWPLHAAQALGEQPDVPKQYMRAF
ncbi:MAG: NADH:flavin oxidoreductase/NADH oxidase [Alicyclobacillaceae bacterium]|nr:NADH:flavin oxidoreductase/NADH oxidase [Alicyclobacillaceae bacterium]